MEDKNMQNEQLMNTADGLGLVAAMLWVVILMASVMVSATVQRKNERKQYAQVGGTKMYGVGLEIEAIRNTHAQEAPNQKIAVWLNHRKAVDSPSVFRRFTEFLLAKNANARKTRAARRAYMRDATRQDPTANHEFISSDWMSGRTTSGQTRVTTDGSLSSGGFEVVSPPLAPTQVRAWVMETAEPLRAIATINTTTGLHAHIALRKPDEEFGTNGVMSVQEARSISARTAWAWSYFWPSMKKMFPVSRWSNTYAQWHDLCSVIPHDSHETRVYDHHLEDYIISKVTGHRHYEVVFDHHTVHGRYQHLNLQSMFNRGFGTIEFRAHQGTLSPMKITRWVEFCTRFVAACEDETNYLGITGYDDSMQGLWSFMDLEADHHLSDYYNKRIQAIHHQGLNNPPCPDCGSVKCVHGDVCHRVIDRQQALQSFDDVHMNRVICLHNSHVRCTNHSCNERFTVDNLVEHNDAVLGHIRELMDLPMTEVHDGYMFDNLDLHCPYCGQDEEWELSRLRTVYEYQSGLLASIALGIAVASPLISAVALLVACGIGAIHSGSVRGNNAKRATGRLFVGLASRGGQASGAAWYNSDAKGSVWRLKEAVSSVALANRVLKYFTKKTVWMMMHTRFATHGVNDADNAHPHMGPNERVHLVHNGVVHNYDDAWKGLGIKPTGPVDSQAVAACLEVGGIEKVVELCEGSMSLIWSDNRDPAGTLKFWSNGGNPLHAGRLDTNTGIVVVGSTKKHLQDAYGKRLKTEWAVTIGREYTVTPKGVITHRDIKGSAETAGVSYDWRTYATWNKTPAKASGDGDTCALTPETKWVKASYDWDDMRLNDAIDTAYNDMLSPVWNSKHASYYQSWKSFDGYHGFNGQSHIGVRPDGTKYDIPLRWADGKSVEPDYCSDTMVMVLTGQFDPNPPADEPEFPITVLNEFDDEWYNMVGDNGDWYFH